MRIKNILLSSPFQQLLEQALVFLRNPISTVKNIRNEFIKNSRRKIISQYCEIIEEIPLEFKQFLTDKDNLITPQESFLNYFKDAIPKYDVDIFKVKFVETFCSIGKRSLFYTFKKQNSDGLSHSNEFWKGFEILFDGMPGSIKSTEISFPRIKIFFLALKSLIIKKLPK